MPSSPSRFIAEGGKFHLAEALFDAFKYKIRCPDCVGNSTQPGFIKDEGGKGGKDRQKRRQWFCQRSNSRSVTSKCGRVSCTEYIDLARKQLDDTQFDGVLQHVCETFPPNQDEYAALQGYLNPSPGEPVAPDPTPSLPAIVKKQAVEERPATKTPDPCPPSKKRKAQAELPFRDKTDRHSQAQQRRESSESDTRLQETLQRLGELVEIGKTWKDRKSVV